MRILSLFIVICLLGSCNFYQNCYYSFICEIADIDQITYDDSVFNAAYSPVTSALCSYDATEFYAAGSVTYVDDGGYEMIEVSRADGRYLTREDQEIAEVVAKIACEQNPDWSPGTFMPLLKTGDFLDNLIFGPDRVVDPIEPRDYLPYLTDGIWSVHPQCSAREQD